MRAVHLTAPGRLEIRDVPRPTPGPGELVLRVRASLTCGTDLKAWRRGHPLLPFPTPLGHEFSGEVEAVGSGVESWSVGQPIMAVHTAPCGECGECLRAQPNLCDAAVNGMVTGSHAEYVKLPAHVVALNTFPKPDHLSWTEAALLEPLSCVVQGQHKAGPCRGETVAIIGAGAIGLLQVLVARQRGATRIVVFGHREERLELARRLGADAAVDRRELEQPELAALLGGSGADLVVECAGTTAAWEEALGLARRGGRVLFFGGCPVGTTVSLDTRRIHYDELTFMGSFHFGPPAVAEAYELLTGTKLDTAPLITACTSLERAIEVFDDLAEGRGVKYAFEP